jgi:hypothetical protein
MDGMTARGPHVCPSCGERVSAFAAGCAVCGADLDPKRAAGPPRAGQRLRGLWLARPRLRGPALPRRTRRG